MMLFEKSETEWEEGKKEEKKEGKNRSRTGRCYNYKRFKSLN